ncbi:MAG: isoprenylcysteine carboxylmethyltransferase family protein [Acetobacteraceae bacterium]|nr:isoprenylcysteine carboxylmethyltransferase family protein [Acetobacteraceae bacterium]
MAEPPPPPDRGPGVKVPPPVWFLLCVGAAWGLHRLLPVAIAPPLVEFGLAVALVGLGLIVAALVVMLAARTDPRPDRPDRALVTHGPFRVSRNPIYLGFLIVAAGIALMSGSAWAWLAVAVLFGLLDRLVVAKEEAYLLARFGKDYADYAARVRRWM